MGYNFGHTSTLQKATCHQDLQLIVDTSIQITVVDFGISEGHRSKTLQLEYFQKGLSDKDGITDPSKHNYMPSLALDFYAFVNGKASYDPEHLSYLAGLFHGVAEMLLAQGKISHRLRWGGNWDQDGEILLDQEFDDRPHIELVPVA